MGIVRYLIKSTPAFLAFIIAPYLFFLGSSYDEEKLRAFNLDGAGLSSLGANSILSGFHVWANTTAQVVVLTIVLLLLVLIPALCFTLWFRWTSWKGVRKLRVKIRFVRRKLRRAWIWAMVDTGAIIAPAIGAVVWVILTSVLMQGLGALDLGGATARRDIKTIKEALPTCFESGAKPSNLCVTIVFPNETLRGIVLTTTADRIAVLDKSGQPILRDVKSATRFLKPASNPMPLPAAHAGDCKPAESSPPSPGSSSNGGAQSGNRERSK